MLGQLEVASDAGAVFRTFGPAKRERRKEAAPDSCDMREIEITAADNGSCEEEEVPVEIILNRNGVFRRSGPEQPALVVAWPI